jgi:hypothetical protein
MTLSVIPSLSIILLLKSPQAMGQHFLTGISMYDFKNNLVNIFNFCY